MYSTNRSKQQHLAWHETLELHELTAFQTTHLTCFKMDIAEIKDPQLRNLYAEAIQSIEQNLKELLAFYPQAPVPTRTSKGEDLTAFYAAHLLGFAKTAVRSYAIAITETATPSLRELLQKQLNQAIVFHGKVFRYMYEHGMYPSYDLNQLLANDQKNAKIALSMS